jgi:glycosyltransferase involved in cell wall biosynthesis
MRGYDVIRIFMPWGNRGLEHIYVASRLGVPALVSAHNTFGTKVLQTGWHDRFLHMSFQNVSGVYGLSQSALDNFASRFQNYMLDRTVRRVIPNAIDTDLFCPSGQAGSTLRASLGLSPDTKVIGCVGRLSTHKRPSFVIDVFERVVHTIPQNVHLVMIGNGELAKQCENEIENRNLQHHVTLIGRTQAVPDFMAGFDLHLLLSSVEGFGQVNIEAMACGVPSVATNVAGTNEVVRDGVDGFLVPVHDKEAACNRICEILENRDLAQTMGANGRQRAKASFSLEKRAKKICAFYEDALRSRIQNRSSEKVPFLETSS